MAVFLPIAIVQRGLKKKSLSQSGALAGIVVAFFAILCHWSFLASLMAFFFSSSKATKYKVLSTQVGIDCHSFKNDAVSYLGRIKTSN